MAPQNIHGTALLVDDRGVLVTGASGAGKTTLALALIDQFSTRGLFCGLIADDRLLAGGYGGRLVCRAPEAIAGLVEVPGIGPQRTIHEPGAVVDLVIRLVPPKQMVRFQEDAQECIAGCAVPLLDLPERNIAAALPAVAARLGLAPFV